MLDKGYDKVGKDFPVFIHPTSKEEYALAKKETKTGEGYNGFSYEWENNCKCPDCGAQDWEDG